MSDDPKPTPQPIDLSKWATPVSVLLLGAVLLYQQVRGPVVPTPTPAPIIIEPTKFDPETTVVLQDGKVLAKVKAKPIIDAVNNGNATYTVRGFVEGKQEETRSVVVSGGAVPPVPVPPGPVPPGPNPPEPAPIPSTGFRVLFVYENNPTSPEAILPKEQQAALFSPNVAAYLDSKCAKGPDGKTPEWRRFDQNQSLERESSVWVEAMKLPRNVLPWVVISDGKTGFSGPLPENEAALLALLKKYGGQ